MEKLSFFVFWEYPRTSKTWKESNAERKRSRFIDIENELMVTREEEGEGQDKDRALIGTNY